MKAWKARKRRYKVLHDARLEGFTDLPGEPKWTIYVDPTLAPKAHLEAACHESLHALYPEASETNVLEAGNQQMKFLWALGYRRVIE